MSNWLSKFGAQTAKPTRYGILWQNRMATGIWTQRNCLRDAASTRIEEEFYGARGDALIDGLNCEVSAKLTFIRRPGTSVYNSQLIPPINRFYGFNPVINNQEQIHVVADVASRGVLAPLIVQISTVEGTRVQTGGSGSSPIYTYYTTVTFAVTPPPLVVDQTYSFSGLTGLVSLNGQSLPPISAAADSVTFQFGTSVFGPTSDTGDANISPDVTVAPSVRDVTGPSTNKILWTKALNASVTSFLGVGNTLYASDGVESHKLIESADVWEPSVSFSSGQFIVDSNGNLQENIGSQTGGISDIQIAGGTATLFFVPGGGLTVPIGTSVSLSGLTTVPALNNTTQIVTGTSNTLQIQFASSGAQSYAAETGQATTGIGITGSTLPTWLTAYGAVTQDGSTQWTNRGSQVETWGIAAPTTAPTVTQTSAPNPYAAWAASTWYGPLFVILDTNGNLQQLTTAGTTGATAPTWSATVGDTTPENSPGTAIWTNLGSEAWAYSTTYAVGALVQATFYYWITVYGPTQVWEADIGQYVTVYEDSQQQVTVTCLFQCTVGGTSQSGGIPNWTNGLGTTTIESTGVTWINQGVAPAWPGATQTLSLSTQLLDSNNNVETVQHTGESGTSAPSWNITQGATTPDNATSWLNSGPYSPTNTGAWIYAYSFENSVSGQISTASPESLPIIVTADNLVVIQGVGSTDLQVDTIVIWRTVQGGSQLFYLGQIPNPGTPTNSGNWIYTDTIPDTSLNELIEAPIDGINNPPPTGLTALAYHLGRIWGAVNNLVYFSTGPDVTAGNGNESWSASNVFEFPDNVVRLFPTASGLIVFTTADIYIIQGLGTTTSAFFSAPMVQNIGLVSYDAFAINGGTVYLFTSDNQVVCIDPNSGFSEVGFPIGDQFGPNNGTGTFTPSSTQVTWHVAGSEDKALYVSDSRGTWWRLCPTPSPESGWTWSPKAQIVGGFSAVQSIEVVPGTHNLLIGPPDPQPASMGPILKRDYSVYSDNGSAYPAWAVLGSLVLAQPGQLAHVPFITTDSVAIGTPISLAVQLDEISPISAGYFETLSLAVPDPTQLSPSLSTYAQRFYLSQTQKPAVCRHMQVQINWGTDVVKNELLSLSIFGGFSQEN